MKKIIIAILFTIVFNSVVKAQTSTAIKDTTITLKVKGLTCSIDLKTIAKNVTDLKGVSTCKPGKLGPTSTYKVTFNTEFVKLADVINAIENTPGCGDGDAKPYKVRKN